jgi:hypothetical protein
MTGSFVCRCGTGGTAGRAADFIGGREVSWMMAGLSICQAYSAGVITGWRAQSTPREPHAPDSLAIASALSHPSCVYVESTGGTLPCRQGSAQTRGWPTVLRQAARLQSQGPPPPPLRSLTDSSCAPTEATPNVNQPIGATRTAHPLTAAAYYREHTSMHSNIRPVVSLKCHRPRQQHREQHKQHALGASASTQATCTRAVRHRRSSNTTHSGAHTTR